ncbi:MAG: dephospho-CoA kinase [Nitrospirota bacterium]
MVVGLTGGIACGKSLVAGHFQRLGAHIIDTDELAHELLEPGRAGYEAVLAAFGPDILDRNGPSPPAISRRRLGALVFGDSAQRARLEAILHPLIFAEAARRRSAIEAAAPKALIVLVVPLLFETGADRLVDRTVAVTADEETQAARLMARDGLDRDAALRRVRAQWPASEKRRRADDWIDGGRTPDEVRRQVEALYKKFTVD